MDARETPAAVIAYARAANARRPRVVSSCLICGQSSVPSYATRRYCSNACRQRAKRQRAHLGRGQTLCTPADRAFWAELEL